MNTIAELKRHVKEQDKEIFDLIAKVIEVIADNNLWGDYPYEYKFKDGEVWHRFDPEHDLAKNTGKLEETPSE
jgi:hypothetical protein